MPVDLRLPHEIVTQLIDIYTPPSQNASFRTRPRGRVYDAEKRYATYFSSKASFCTEWRSVEDESTWEFSAPVAPMARSLSTETCSSAWTTAAQEIASRYRAGMPLKAVLSDLNSISVSSGESNDTSWETALEDTSVASKAEVPPPVPEKDHLVMAQCKSFHDQELSTSLQEALNTIKREGGNENDLLMCHRPGCRDVVRNVEALMFHIHIHNIHDEMLRCNSCNKQFNHTLQLSLHRCRSEESWFPSALYSPLKGCFFNVFRMRCFD